MVQMATPYLHPETRVYYLRRQIPKELRPAFGGKSLFKRSLETKDVSRAATLFTAANAELERQFEEVRARLRLTGSPVPTDREQAEELVQAYFHGSEFTEGGLDGPERLELARIEIDRGLWNETESGLSNPPPVDEARWWELSGNAALFRGWTGRRPVARNSPGTIWRYEDRAFAHGARDRQIERVVQQIGRFNDTDPQELPQTLPAAISAFLNDQPVGPSRERKVRRVNSRLRPDMRMTELFEEWRTKANASEQTSHEFEQSLTDFVEMIGDIPASQVTDEDLLDYRDEALNLPKSMPRADRELPFKRRLAKHANSKAPRISPATLKKRVGAIQAILTLAFKQKWIAANVGQGIPIEGSSPGNALKPRNFEESEMRTLFSSRLFLAPERWSRKRKVGDPTLYWLFLFALTTGARIEEVGQALLSDVKADGRVVYIDIDDYVEDDVDASKSLKTTGSRRLIPVHDNLLSFGFLKYVADLRSKGKVQLFPDLVAGTFGKHTKEASRTANGVIDRVVSNDRRLRFHSFRHQFKDFALEAGITGRIVDHMTGHAPTTVGGRYGSGVRLPQLHQLLHKINWSFIDWQAMESASQRASWNSIKTGSST